MNTEKELIETRNGYIEKIENLGAVAKTREITEDEKSEFERLKREISNIDTRLEVLKYENNKIETKEIVDQLPISHELRSILNNPAQVFRDYGLGANNNFKLSDSGQGGVIMPKTLSDKIIEKAYAESDILPFVTKYDVTGQYIIPKFDRSTIKVAFYDEFAETIQSNAKFESIELVAHRISGLVIISRSLINNVNVDIESYIVGQLALIFKEALEEWICKGAAGKFDSIFTASADKTITLAAKDNWSIDTLIDIRTKLHNAFQKKAVYVMHPETLSALRKLKDSNGQYYVLADVTKNFGFTILGTQVYTSDFAPKDAILYGDLSCYGLSSSQNMSLQVLHEKYATQYAVGAVIHGEYGGKIVNEEGLAVIKNKA